MAVRALIAAPVLYALGFVLTVYADSGNALESLPRPLAVAGLAAMVLQVAVSLLLRSATRGAFVTLVVLAFLTHPLLAVILVICAVVVIGYSRWRGFPPAPFTSGLGTIVVIVFALSSVRAVTSPAFAVGDLFRGGGAVRASENVGPDIFLIMLDAYPRSDTLTGWGYDNGWFEDELSKRGFQVAPNSTTDYIDTDLVLPTTFNMRPADDLEGLLSSDGDRRARAIRNALEDPLALQVLRDRGYTTFSVGHPDDYISLNTDRYIDAGRLTDFEHQVLNRTRLARLTLPMVLDARRGLVFDSLAAAPRIAHDPSPTFLFAHLLNPHTPFLFDRSGDLPTVPCLPCAFSIHWQQSGMTEGEFHRMYTDQVDYLNGLVLDAIDGILEASPDAVIVVFGDHGSRANIVHDAEWNRNFFAARGVHYPDDVKPIDIFPALFEELF